jgi:hypothetical protein
MPQDKHKPRIGRITLRRAFTAIRIAVQRNWDCSPEELKSYRSGTITLILFHTFRSLEYNWN